MLRRRETTTCSEHQMKVNSNSNLSLLRVFGMTPGIMPAVHPQVAAEVPPVIPGAKPVTVEHIRVHGDGLEGNPGGDDADWEAIVFPPPSCATQKNRRYPVVYATGVR